MLRLAVCAYMALARLAELAWSRQNIRQSPAPREGAWSRRSYLAIVAVHTVTIVGTAIFGSRRERRPLLSVLLLVQALRAWVLLSLGRRWNARGAVAADLKVETGGPYRWVRHPNYAVVIIELAVLPAAFRLGRLSAGVSLVNGLLLAIRIRDEERLLRESPEWVAHFEHRKRFLPRLF